jgi:hypothetical protein
MSVGMLFDVCTFLICLIPIGTLLSSAVYLLDPRV